MFAILTITARGAIHRRAFVHGAGFEAAIGRFSLASGVRAPLALVKLTLKYFSFTHTFTHINIVLYNLQQLLM